MKKSEIERRKAFIKDMVKENYSPLAILQAYDREFGTHYYEREFPLSAKAEKYWREMYGVS